MNFRMIKKAYLSVFITLFIVPILIVGAAECAENPKYGGTLRIAITSDLSALDWAATTSSAPRMVGMHIFESLTTFSKELNVIPMLAKSWEKSEGGKEWTFHLRKGVPFQSGYGEMTADDVVASWKRLMHVSPVASTYVGMDEKSATAVDDYTVRFKGNEPINLPVMLALPIPPLIVMPKETVIKNGKPVDAGKIPLKEFVGTGPFILDSYETGNHYTLIRFKDYVPNDFPASGLGGKRVAYVDKVVFKPIPEVGSRLAGLETGAYDVIMAAPITELSTIVKNPDLVPEKIYFAWVGFVFNVSKAPFKDIKMRRAIQAALCMDDIMRAAGYNNPDFYVVDSGFYKPGSIWNTNIGDKYYNQCNPEKAKRLLKEAGYNNEPIKMISNHSYPAHYRASMVCLEQLTKIGMNIDFELYDWPGMKAKRRDYSYWDISYTSHSMRFDPALNYSLWYGPSRKYNWRGLPEIDRLLERDMKNVLEFEERYKLHEQVQLLALQHASPELSLGKAYTLQARNKRVKGFDAWYLVRAWNVWLED